MKTDRNILIAFLLNLGFSVFEFLGGVLTGSVAIISDAVHDLGDATSIGISYFLERKSKHRPDEKFTFGYARFSVIGSVITTLILLLGSVAVIFNAVNRILHPAAIHYDGVIVFAVIGMCVNAIAAFATRDGKSLNQKAVNLHMLEDVLGWVVVLIGAVIMRFTDLVIIDPILSIGIAIFIMVHAVDHLKEAVELLLQKAPHNIHMGELRTHLMGVPGVLDVHHIHIWSMDGQSNCATMHVVTDEDPHLMKERIREELHEHDITHATLELERPDEHCHDRDCQVRCQQPAQHQHHHHHHH